MIRSLGDNYSAIRIEMEKSQFRKPNGMCRAQIFFVVVVFVDVVVVFPKTNENCGGDFAGEMRKKYNKFSNGNNVPRAKSKTKINTLRPINNNNHIIKS